MNAVKTIFDIFQDFLEGFQKIWEWLTEPLWGDITPLGIFGVTGLTAILAILVIHFLNPVN